MSLKQLPTELYQSIFQNLDPSSLISCMYVLNNNVCIIKEIKHIITRINYKSYIFNDDIDAIKRMLYHMYIKKRFNCLNNIYKLSIIYKSFKILLFMQERIPELNVNESFNNKIPIEYFIEYKQEKLIYSIIKHSNFDPNCNSILVNANYKISKLIIETHFSYVNVNATKNDFTPLMSAIANKDFEKINLLSSHPKIKINKKIFGNQTPLHYLLESGGSISFIFNTMNLFLSHPKINLKMKNIEGENALHIAVRNGLSNLIVNRLIRNGVKINTRTKNITLPDGKIKLGKTVIDYLFIYEKHLDL